MLGDSRSNSTTGMTFLLYTWTSALIIHISNLQRTQKFSAVCVLFLTPRPKKNKNKTKQQQQQEIAHLDLKKRATIHP